MPVVTDITQLSTTAASNYPAGTENANTVDDYIRQQSAFIAQLRDRVISVKDYGATGDGTTDDSDAIQDALNAAATSAAAGDVVTVYFPPGNYYCANDSATQVQIKSSVKLLGAGMYQSVIQFDDSASIVRRDFLTTDTAGAYNIEIEGVGFNGDWGTGDFTQRSHLIELSTTGNVTVSKCRFSNGRYFGLVITNAVKVSVVGCEFYRMCADGLHVTRTASLIASDNYFEAVNDDSIGYHTMDDVTAPVKVGASITGNRIIDSQGIAVLGGKHISIVGNSITRAHTRAIHVGGQSGGVQGNTAAVNITISGNMIDTVFDGSVFSASTGSSNEYIYVDSPVPTTNGSGYVGQPDGAGAIVDPFDYFYDNNSDTVAPVVGTWFVNISGNTCIRTLEATAAYTDYGYGSRYGRSGSTAPAITAANLGSGRPLIQVSNHGQGVSISDNVLWGGGYGIWLNGTASSAYLSWRDVNISSNNISNFVVSGVYVKGEGVVEVDGCLFDGDPLHTHADRAANGKWGAGWENNSAIWVSGCNLSISGCKFRNVGTIYRGTSPDESVWRGNVMYCNPAVYGGYNAGNIGIGNPQPPARIDAALHIEDGDPASATYGTVLNSCVIAASAMPASGKYPQGYFVRNWLPSVAGSAGSKYVVMGWIRLTTGSNHVADVDWAEARSLTGA